MTDSITPDSDSHRSSRWRLVAWSIPVLLLLIPFIGTQVSDEVDWSAFDFVFAGALFLSVGLGLELAVRKTGDTAYRIGAGVALVTGLLLVWVNGAVGIIGSEDNSANLLYGGVLAIAVIGALVSRFRSRGMSRAMAAAALAQGAVAAGALVAGWGGEASGPFEIVAINGVFVALWAGAAVLFLNAADRQDTNA